MFLLEKLHRKIIFKCITISVVLFFMGLFGFAQTADFSININQGCVPLSGVNFTDISGGGTVQSRDWDLGNGTVITNGAATVGTNYLTANTYTVTLTVTFTNGVVSSKQKTVTVHPKPIANFSSLDTIGCVSHTANFSSTSTTATGTLTNYQWDFGAGGVTGTNPTPSFIYNSTGTYQVSLIVKNSWGCSSDAATKTAYIKVFPRPNAYFTVNPYYSCDNSFTASFVNGTIGGDPTRNKYEWNFGDGSLVENTPNASHLYTGVGNYTATLKVSLGNNCVSTYSQTIYVGKPTPSFTVFPDTVCVNNAITFAGAGTPNTYYLKWFFTDNNQVHYYAPIQHTFTTPGTYEVQLIAYNYPGCSDTIRRNIVVKPGPIINFTPNIVNSNCIPQTVTFTNNTVGTDLKFAWNYGDGSPTDTINGQGAAVHTYTNFGNFTVTVYAIDTTAGGCYATKTFNYIRIYQPSVVINVVPPIGCKPLPVNFSATANNAIVPIINYAWNFGDGSPILNTAIANAFHLYNTAGAFPVSVTITMQGGCTFTSPTKTVTVIDICDDDGTGTGGAGGGFTIGKTCTDKYTILFTDTVANTVVQSWNFGDGSPLLTTGIINPVSHTYTPPQKVYLVTVTRLDTITNIVSTTQKNIKIIDEKANFVPDITSICKDKNVKFFTIGIDSSLIKKYTWDFGDGTPRQIINNALNFSFYGTYLNGNTNHTYISNGVFYVKLIIEDKLGCLDSLQYPVPITVAGPIAGFFANPLTSCSSPLLTTFTDTSIQNGATPIVQWQWSFGDGTPLYSVNSDTAFTHNYIGNSYVNFYNVTLKITDAIGCEAMVTKPSYIRIYKPKADFFSYDTLKCNSYNVFLYNFSSAYNATYTWYYGDGTSSTGFYGSHTYTTDGTYDIKLVVTDENGCKDSITKPAYIKFVKPKAEFKINDTLQCAPASIIFSDSSTYAVNYLWDFGDGSGPSTDKNPAPHIYGTPGYYNVKLKIVGVSGCIDSIVKQIRVRGPIANWNAIAGNGCKPYLFNAAVTGSFINTYSWDFGDGTPVNPSTTQSSVAHSYINAGKYIPNVILVSSEGCPYTIKLNDTIYVDSARAFFNPLNSVFCGNGTVSFSSLSKVPNFSSITSFNWNFGDGSPNATIANPTPHNYTTGNYNVALTITSQYGCTNTFTQPLAVIINPLPLAKIVGDSIKCKSGNYIYNSNIISTDAIQNYEWKVNGNVVAASQNLNYYFAPGNYIIKLKVKTIKNCEDSTSKIIIVDSIKPLFNVVNPIRCANDLNVQFNNTSTSQFGINNFAWSFGDNSFSNVQNPPIHIYSNYGNYNVTLTTTSVHGCVDSFKIAPAVILNPLPSAKILGDSIKCKSGNYNYNSNINSIDAIQTYEWKVNGNVAATSQNLNYYFAPGNYVISLKVKTINGCEDVTSKIIIVDSIKPLFNVVNPIRCANDLNVQFNNTSTSQFGISNYFWSFGDNTLSPLQNPPIHPYPSYGNYNVTLTATSIHGCVDSFKIVPAVIIHPMPQATIVGNALECKPGNYFYASNITSMDAIQNYEWKVNGNVVSTTPNLNFNFFAGNYTVALKVKTVNGCSYDTQRNITIDSVKANFNVINPIRCGNNNNVVTFSNLSGGIFGIASYNWDFGDGQTGTGINPTHIYNLPGTYSIQLIVRSANGCIDTYTKPNAITIYSTPIITINNVLEKCANSSIIFASQTVTTDAIVNYQWKINSAVVGGNIDTLNHFFTTAGNYTVSLQVSTANGCIVTKSTNVTIRALPVPAAAPNTTICEGSTVNLQANDGVNYVWTPNTTLQNPTAPNPIATPMIDTKYYVTVTNIYGCIQTDSILIQVDKKVNLQKPNEERICRGASVALTASGNSTNFIWSPATGLNTTNSATVIANPPNTTLYQVIGVSSNVCKNDTGYVNVVVGPIPTVNLGPDTTIQSGTNVVLNALTTGGVTNYSWQPFTGLSCSTCAQTNFYADKNITYKVTVTTNFGCTATDEINIIVLCGKGSVFIPSAFTPNGDGKNDKFYIQGYGIAKVKKFSVFDRWGKRVFYKENVPANNDMYGWDGRVNNKVVPTATAFVYSVELECTEGKTVFLKGTIVLVQ